MGTTIDENIDRKMPKTVPILIFEDLETKDPDAK